jgi:GTP-binding protein Era
MQRTATTMRVFRQANRLSSQVYGRFRYPSALINRSFHQHAINMEEQRKRLDVAIVGLPNAGKSQLLNVLTQSTVAAVSRKRHTTRDEILGARTVDNTQLVFLDTPGFLRYDHARKEGLDRDIAATATAELDNVDFTLLVVDAARRMTDDYRESLIELMLRALQSKGRTELSTEEEEEDDDDDDDDDGNDDSQGPSTIAQLEQEIEQELEREDVVRPRFAVVLNKCDLVKPKFELIDVAEYLGGMAEECVKYRGQTTEKKDVDVKLDEEDIEDLLPYFFYTSAVKKEGVDDVLNFLLEQATPTTAWEVEAGESSMQSPEERVEEVIREKIYRCLHKEVPYAIRQNNRLFQVVKDKSGKPGLLIHQDLIVRSKSHQELVFGGEGKTLERIRETAERDMKTMFECEVVLQLHVKLLKKRQRNWSI